MSEQQPDQQPGTPPAEAQNTDQPAEHMIPKSRFDEVNTQLRKLQAEQAQREQSERAAAEKAAAERGEWEKIASERGAKLETVEREREQHSAKLEAMSAAMEGHIKARIKALPEELRELLIDGDVLSRYEQLGKLEAAAAKLGALPSAPRGTPPGPRGGGTAPSSASNLADIIAEKRARLGGL